LPITDHRLRRHVTVNITLVAFVIFLKEFNHIFVTGHTRMKHGILIPWRYQVWISAIFKQDPGDFIVVASYGANEGGTVAVYLPVNIGAMGDQVLYRLQVSFPRSHQQRRSVAAQLSVNVRLAVYQVFYKIKMSVSGSSHKRRFVARRVKFNVRTRGHEQFANGEVAVSGGRNQR